MYLPVAGITDPIQDALNAVLVALNDVGIGWGLGIVLLTFLTRIVILPLSVKQIRSMRALQALQPQLKQIQEKYKDDKERQQREMLDFYRTNKINPLASCWPLLLQMPVFISLYFLLRGDQFRADVNLDDVHGAGFLFVESLIEKAVGPELVILIVLFIATQFAAGLVMAAKLEGPQRAIMFILPLVIAPFIITQPAGLAVYWISTNIWTLGQQYVVTHIFPAPEPPTPEEIQAAKPPPPPPRKKKKR